MDKGGTPPYILAMKATETGYDAGYHALGRGEPIQAELWRRAHTAYCEGMTLKEVAELTGINDNTLRAKAKDDDWHASRRLLALAKVEHRGSAVEKTERQIARIRENRERNLASAVELRDVAIDIISKLKAGTLTVQKAFNTKTGPLILDMQPSSGDLVNIATFLRTVADLTYRALGDAPADSKADPNATASTIHAPAGITVILPAVAVAPRQRRARVNAPPVDVESSVTEADQPDVAIPPSEPSPSDEAAPAA